SIPVSMLLALAAVMFFTRSNGVRIVEICVLATPMVHIVFSPIMDARNRTQAVVGSGQSNRRDRDSTARSRSGSLGKRIRRHVRGLVRGVAQSLGSMW